MALAPSSEPEASSAARRSSSRSASARAHRSACSACRLQETEVARLGHQQLVQDCKLIFVLKAAPQHHLTMLPAARTMPLAEDNGLCDSVQQLPASL